MSDVWQWVMDPGVLVATYLYWTLDIDRKSVV